MLTVMTILNILEREFCPSKVYLHLPYLSSTCSTVQVTYKCCLCVRYTPLMEASREGHLDMVALLLEHGKY